MLVPVCDPGAENALFGAEIEDALRRVLKGGVYVLGPEVEAFEAEFAEFVGTRYAVGTASGTDALMLALAALGIGRGDEVITVSHTAGATVAAILHTGAIPVLVDIDPTTFTLHPLAAEAALTSRTRAIVPVHLYGGAVDLSPVVELARRYGLALVEDCSQAHGTLYDGKHVGSSADAGVFSFYPTKNLAALGDGGAVVTADRGLAERISRLRQYGWRTPQVSEELGWNSRLDELQAAVLRVKLAKLSRLLATRRTTALLYAHEIRTEWVIHPRTHHGVEHSFHLYVVRTSHRDALAEHLRAQGVTTAVHYRVPVHVQPAYASVCIAQPMPETTRAADEILSLPMFAAMASGDTLRVVEAVNSFSPPRAATAQ
jgi:dTDP-4-amino-4,6-dideoxygalactose transaminase